MIEENTKSSQTHRVPESAQKDVALVLLRIGTGLLTMWWGIEKLVHFRMLAPGFPDPLGLGPGASLVATIVAQVPCSLLVVLGCWTRVAAVPPAIAMFVAAFAIHRGGDTVYVRHALIYSLCYMCIAVAGSGKYSIDRFVRKIPT
jgi:putative oxidoreductase